jgi:cytochrome P450
VGDAVLLSTSAANRDPRTLPNPDRFDIARTPNPHLAFGHGSLYCISAGLARVELQEVLPRTIQRLPNLRPAVSREHLRLRHDRLAGGVGELPITW